ncbi:MAG: hypothetical protein AAF533_04940 [Acidobacteriota bacterium]
MLRRRALSTFTLLLITLSSDARARSWVLELGSSDREALGRFGVNAEGQVLAFGTTFGMTESRRWLALFSPEGDVLGRWHYEGSYDHVSSINVLPLSDGDWLITLSVGVDPDPFPIEQLLVRLNPDMTIQWSILFGSDDRNDIIDHVLERNDGSIVASGAARNDALLLSLNPDGTLQWSRLWDAGAPTCGFNRVLPLGDDGLLLLGEAPRGSSFNSRLFLAEANGDGDLLSMQGLLFGEALTGRTGLTETGDGGWCLAAYGRTAEAVPRQGAWIAKLDADRSLSWSRFVLPAEGPSAPPASVAGTATGGCVTMHQNSLPPRAQEEILILAFDRDGDLDWSRHHGFEEDDFGATLLEAPDGAYLVTGGTEQAEPVVDPLERRALLFRMEPDNSLPPACTWGRDVTVQVEDGTPSDHAIELTEVTSEPRLRPFSLVLTPAPLASAFACEPACRQLECGAIDIEPSNPCPGDSVVLSVDPIGEGTLVIEWDLDDDGIFEPGGTSVSTSFDAGSHEVTVRVTDGCADPEAASCELSGIVEVAANDVAEVSDVRSGARPLLLTPESVLVGPVAAATAYNLFVGPIGDWRSPSLMDTTCHVDAWTLDGDGHLVLEHVTPGDTWVVVTASSACNEGTAGSGSDAVARETSPDWTSCGASP